MCELFKQGCVPVAWNSVLYQLVASTEMVRIIDAEIQLMEREHACEFMQSDSVSWWRGRVMVFYSWKALAVYSLARRPKTDFDNTPVKLVNNVKRSI
jgi:hypothetical protein